MALRWKQLCNDLWRMILVEATATPSDINQLQQICRKFYSICHSNQFWKKLYTREFGAQKLSDIANYQILYLKKRNDQVDHTQFVVPLHEFLPEKMVFGIVTTGGGNYHQTKVWYYDQISGNKIPLYMRVSGFKLRFPINYRYYYRSQNWTIDTFKNKAFQMQFNYLCQYVLKNYQTLLMRPNNRRIVYNGTQYNNIGDITAENPSLDQLRGPIVDGIEIDKKSYLWNQKIDINWNVRIYANCQHCQKQHQIRTGYNTLQCPYLAATKTPYLIVDSIVGFEIMGFVINNNKTLKCQIKIKDLVINY